VPRLAGFLEGKGIILAQQTIFDMDRQTSMLPMRMDRALASFRTLPEQAIQAENPEAARDK